MNSKRWKWMVAVLALGLLATLAVAQTATRVAAHGRGEFGLGHMLGFYTDYLDLTDAQQAQMKDILAKEKPTIQPLMQQLRTNRQQLQQLENGDTFDQTKVRAAATLQAQTMTELIVERARIKNEMMQVLTADQKAKLANFTARRQQRFQRHMQAPAQTQ